MSHWQKGKINLVCNMQRMIEAIKATMPDWADHIISDPSGKIPIYSYTGKLMEYNTTDGSKNGQTQTYTDEDGDVVQQELQKIGTFHIMIPGRANPNHEQAPGNVYNDIGMKMLPDGTWEIQVDKSGLRTVKNLDQQIANMAGVQRLHQAAKKAGWKVDTFEKQGKEFKLVVRPPAIVKQKHSRVRG